MELSEILAKCDHTLLTHLAQIMLRPSHCYKRYISRNFIKN